MNIIPAIDLLNNQCVRLKQGDYRQATLYSKQPEEVAKTFEALGVPWIHIVDLDAAKSGSPINLPSIERILASVSIPIQVGGGIRSLERAEQLLRLGVRRIIVGTAAIEDLALLQTLVRSYGNQIVVGVDAMNGIVKTRGWTVSTQRSSLSLIQELESIGVQTIVYTDIAKDGMLEGPNFEMYQTLRQSSSIGIIASGGIASVQDLKLLRTMNLEGAIIGKAFYEGAIDLKEAMQC